MDITIQVGRCSIFLINVHVSPMTILPCYLKIKWKLILLIIMSVVFYFEFLFWGQRFAQTNFIHYNSQDLQNLKHLNIVKNCKNLLSPFQLLNIHNLFCAHMSIFSQITLIIINKTKAKREIGFPSTVWNLYWCFWYYWFSFTP